MKQNTLLVLIIAVAVIIVVLLLLVKLNTNTGNNPIDTNTAKINDPGYTQALNQLDDTDINADLNDSGIVDVGQ